MEWLVLHNSMTASDKRGAQEMAKHCKAYMIVAQLMIEQLSNKCREQKEGDCDDA